MNSGFGREIFILILLFIVIIFTLIVLLYDFLPGKKVEEINSAQYISDNLVIEDVLKEIKESTGVDVKGKDSDVPLKSYSIEAKDLNMYASENSYESGKSDPFSENSNPAEEITRLAPKSSNTVEVQLPNTLSNNIVSSNTNTVTKENNVNLVKKNETTKSNNGAINSTNIVANSSVNNLVKSNTTLSNTTVNNTKSSTTTGVYFEEKDTK